MRIFVTGASGWIGSAVVPELISAGHQVLGLARSDASANAIAGMGADVLRGDLTDTDILRAGALGSDAVIHLANKHDFARPDVSAAAERGAVQTIGDALAGTSKPFLLASGVAALTQGRPATEDDASPFHGPDSPRGRSASARGAPSDKMATMVSSRLPRPVVSPCQATLSRPSRYRHNPAVRNGSPSSGR